MIFKVTMASRSCLWSHHGLSIQLIVGNWSTNLSLTIILELGVLYFMPRIELLLALGIGCKRDGRGDVSNDKEGNKCKLSKKNALWRK